MIAICLLSWAWTNFSIDSRVYQQWRDQSDVWIKAGVQETVSKANFHSKSRLLVLDGDHVVGEIRPNGSFIVILQSRAASAASYWVQVQASRDRSVLEATRSRIANQFPDHRLELFRSENGSMMTLRVGPCDSRTEAGLLQSKGAKAGFTDAFLVRQSTNSPFAWVDSQYDKFPFESNKLGLVSADPETPIGYGDRSYRGILWFRRKGNQFRVINELPMETYLRGVVPSELGPKVYPELEALKAQAVAARTYAIKNMGKFEESGYDICDGPECQAYFGAGVEHPLSDQAVAETKGLVLTYNHELIDALYTSTCGGETEDSEHVFNGKAEPYLRGVSSYVIDREVYPLPCLSPKGTSEVVSVQDLQVRAMIIGFPSPPDLNGELKGSDLSLWLKYCGWILALDEAPQLSAKTMSFASFWEVVSQLPAIRDAVAHQVKAADVSMRLTEKERNGKLHHLVNLLMRYEILTPAMEDDMFSSAVLTRVDAMTLILRLCEGFGPEPEWSKYYVDSVKGNTLVLVRKERERTVDLSRVAACLTKSGGAYQFLNQPQVREGDIIYILDGVLSRSMLHIVSNGLVASADRESAFNYWIDKKSVEQLEERARRYIPELRGIRSVRVVSRSETGRVTRLEFIADSGKHQVTGLRVRWALGVRDTLFDLIPAYRNSRLVHLTAVGRGWGHGVGMSQVGAFGLAKAGWNFEKILKHYYRDVSLVPFDTLIQGN
ncbi:MAG: SpoIID/LytB domain-containing protein [Acidobacteria bacterium]|nr:SpoIID/LytB domain-containing protein [Acidobacteriota bacterium]